MAWVKEKKATSTAGVAEDRPPLQTWQAWASPPMPYRPPHHEGQDGSEDRSAIGSNQQVRPG